MVENRHAEIKKIKKYAENKNIPIMQEEGISFLTTFIYKHHIKSILEIGTAIGYSAIMMASVSDDIKITTVERDEERYLEALKNVKKLGLENRITLLFQDAVDLTLHDKYDLVFLDAAKGQNIKFFENFEKNLNEKGFIITDNMCFHGYVSKDLEEIKSKNLRSLVKKIKEYHQFLEDNEKFETQIYAVGDGIAVSEKK